MLHLKKILIFMLVVIFCTLTLLVIKEMFRDHSAQPIKRSREKSLRPFYYDSTELYTSKKKDTSLLTEDRTQSKQDRDKGFSKGEIIFRDHHTDGVKEEINMNVESKKTVLTKKVIDGVKAFIFFIGYGRSGSSIVSSFIDAHPHAIVSYQYGIFADKNKELLKDKTNLFNKLYRRSQYDIKSGARSHTKKNYTLHVSSLWQGEYDRYISLIGDKNAGKSVDVYVNSPSTFLNRYKILQETVGVPFKVVYVVRNPFDIISTSALYSNGKKLSTSKFDSDDLVMVSHYKSVMKRLYDDGNMKEFQDARLRTEDLTNIISRVVERTKAIEDIIDLIGTDNVWQVHNTDLVDDPKKTLREMCSFFELDCSTDYIDTCAGQVFKSVSRTRDLLVWPQKERQMVMDGIVRRFSFFSRYTFKSD